MVKVNILKNEADRASLVRRGRYLEYFTIRYNSLEGLIAVAAGMVAGSLALIGFGFDSLIEVTSEAVLLWRLHADVNEARRERVEAISLRLCSCTDNGPNYREGRNRSIARRNVL